MADSRIAPPDFDPIGTGVFDSETDGSGPFEGRQPARYTAEDEERWLPEQHGSRRTDFARDRGRLLHSRGSRRRAEMSASCPSATIG